VKIFPNSRGLTLKTVNDIGTGLLQELLGPESRKVIEGIEDFSWQPWADPKNSKSEIEALEDSPGSLGPVLKTVR